MNWLLALLAGGGLYYAASRDTSKTAVGALTSSMVRRPVARRAPLARVYQRAVRPAPLQQAPAFGGGGGGGSAAPEAEPEAASDEPEESSEADDSEAVEGISIAGMRWNGKSLR